ncbi:MAG: F-type H+-transporting ATPase subunit a [Verrucomicrobiota bacterium]
MVGFFTGGTWCPFEQLLSGQMQLIKIILVWLLLAGAPLAVLGASASALNAEADLSAGKSEEHGISQKAEEVGQLLGLPISNSMVVTWIVAVGLIVFSQFATRNMKAIPEGAQNFWEWMVESLHDFLEGIIGHHLVQKTFWFFATIFIFILFSNWMGLIPGIGTVGWHVHYADGHTEWLPLLRGANADLNMTLAMALVFFACWVVWAIQEVGPVGFLLHLFAPKGETTGLLKVLMIVVFFAVGFLEVFSILFRPISLSFRLYGNIFAGENMLEAMSKLIPGFGWLLPIPFYFMELLVGFVQALVFMLLTAVFTMLICQHEEGHEPAHH